LKGDAVLLNKPSVAIVGSRQCSASGVKVCEQFADALANAGYVIVSGLARGIDGHAHRMSLTRGTVAVVAGGVDVIYPPEHEKLHADIAARGCIVSEMPPGYRPRGEDFPRRNRIISGISLGVIVVEAAARSGTLSTARYAREQNREVFAIPGHPLDSRAEGTNNLIKQGATFTTSPDDVIDVLRVMSGMAEDGDALSERMLAQMEPDVSPIAHHETDDVRDAVWQALGPAPCDVDAIVRTTGLPIRAVNVALLELALAERVTYPGSGLVARAV
jgi:DNA processing protein